MNGEILKWHILWDMFCVDVHKEEGINSAEKLVYLGQAVGRGPAAKVIEGLSYDKNPYVEAIVCHGARYDQPRSVHEAYVKAIIEFLKLKGGSDREIHKLHDTMLQNLHALTTMDYVLDPHFITSLIQLKLDSATLFAWKESSKDCVSIISDYNMILQFLDQ